MTRTVRIAWPPKPTKDKYVTHGGRTFNHRRDGQPSIIELARWPEEECLRGDQIIRCCDCGLTHLYTYEIHRDRTGFYLVNRAYRT